MNYESIFANSKEKSLYHRYISLNNIEPLLLQLRTQYEVSEIGKSVKGLPIYGLKIGNGPKRILLWSQMHGNESTTTKALFDLFNYLKTEDTIGSACTLYFIPMLNPDGAKAYTRVNANNVDLNRDAQNLTQPESLVLKHAFESFKPHFCFNLHGQRTIFSAGEANKPATLSFLAPAQDAECSVTTNRKVAMDVIVEINKVLQEVISGQIGVYDDAFNINCVGDTFQKNNVPTILFEAGHYKNDYKREEVRKFIFMSLLTALQGIALNDYIGSNFEAYFNIPENKKLFYDIIIRDVLLDDANQKTIGDIAIQYEEVLASDQIKFSPKVANIGNLSHYFGHREIMANKQKITLEDGIKLEIDAYIDTISINDKEFSLKVENS